MASLPNELMSTFVICRSATSSTWRPYEVAGCWKPSMAMSATTRAAAPVATMPRPSARRVNPRTTDAPVPSTVTPSSAASM